ncbi:6f35f2f7-e47e-469f-ac4b-9e2603baaaf1 [Sclerotinia trifoliorum]|uniref:6f35f2f7-e47e-469f-ac4b-9e2603baaaf1 n=1 Tax=Sclerotinia trifoliorum TaxID=28548 RepID=A0A8H2ZM97_9HELO|nr:6f35f2f7-e47e-469f-ac4b-9e2603baaaf1 [Sclerotinia trifoliorum]
MPIHHDPINPSLTLNSPNPKHKNIILTRPRTTDAEPTIPAFNNPSIYLNLTGPPFPYAQESFDSFFTEVLDKNVRIAVAELWDAREAERNKEGKSWVGAIPFPSIREVVVDERGRRRELFIGQVEVRRRGFVTVLDGEKREGLVGENLERRVGDEGIEWEIGFWLLPSHHGKSIMPSVLQTLLSDFFIPYMNMHFLTGEYLEFNTASRRVFEKCGFKWEGVTEEVERIHDGKLGRWGVVGEERGLGKEEDAGKRKEKSGCGMGRGCLGEGRR